MDALRRAACEFEAAWNLKLRFTRYRGDGWQVLIDAPTLAFDAMIYLRASLIAEDISLDTRISAGFGPVESIGTSDLSDATGDAFFTSGDHLDHAKKRKMLVAGKGIGRWQNAVMLLTENLVSGWTAAQAHAVAASILEGATQEEIAAKLGVTRQAIQLRLAGAGYSALSDALYSFRNHEFEVRPEDA
jgi:choline dehydrogenase-like flavoprotein